MILQSKLFKSGNSKTIKIPKSLGFNSDKVIVKKIDDGIMVIKEDKKNNFWNKWWNSFKTADLQRVQGTQEREDIF